jgi:hypothetical protein
MSVAAGVEEVLLSVVANLSPCGVDEGEAEVEQAARSGVFCDRLERFRPLAGNRCREHLEWHVQNDAGWRRPARLPN